MVRPDFTIIDGFHRWTVAGEEPLVSMLDGKVPVVIVEHKDKARNIYGTVTHNRARGTHLQDPMKAIVKGADGRGKIRGRNWEAAGNEAGGNLPAFRVFQRRLSENDD